MRAIASCVLLNFPVVFAHAAIDVPNPGIIKFKIAQITATGLLTVGTSVTSYQTCLSSAWTGKSLFVANVCA